MGAETWAAPCPPVLRDLNSSQVYHGQRTPAVDRLCLGIPPGEVSPGRGPGAGAWEVPSCVPTALPSAPAARACRPSSNRSLAPAYRLSSDS